MKAKERRIESSKLRYHGVTRDEIARDELALEMMKKGRRIAVLLRCCAVPPLSSTFAG